MFLPMVRNLKTFQIVIEIEEDWGTNKSGQTTRWTTTQEIIYIYRVTIPNKMVICYRGEEFYILQQKEETIPNKYIHCRDFVNIWMTHTDYITVMGSKHFKLDKDLKWILSFISKKLTQTIMREKTTKTWSSMKVLMLKKIIKI